jgi:hypothetical protein
VFHGGVSKKASVSQFFFTGNEGKDKPNYSMISPINILDDDPEKKRINVSTPMASFSRLPFGKQSSDYELPTFGRFA